MLGREFKLKNSDDIKATLKEGRRIRGRHLSVFFRPNSTNGFQAAVVISKKVAETAVRRNRVRRIIFAELSRQLTILVSRAVGSVVILVSAIPEDEKILIADLHQCLKTLSLV